MSLAPPASDTLHVACLCAAWCRLCEGYGPVFGTVMQALRPQHPGLQVHWVDVEDDAALLGELDVETFPTLVVADGAHVRFAGPLLPQAETLQRVLQATLADPAARAAPMPGLQAFAQALRQRGG